MILNAGRIFMSRHVQDQLSLLGDWEPLGEYWEPLVVVETTESTGNH